MSTSEHEPPAADPYYLDSAGRRWGPSVMLNINIVTCSLSFAGSLVMIVPFILFKQLRKIRHRLILGMAVNDLLQAVSVLMPSAWSIYNGAIPTNSPGCKADSFFYLTFVVGSCLWTLAIAITTYITLVQPMSRLANDMHRSRSIYLIWISIWPICLINAGIGTAVNDSVDGAGFCFFPMVAPYLYGNLALFVPRAGTFAIIILIYLRLYIFFRHQASSHHKQESGLHENSFHLQLPTPSSDLHLPQLRSTMESRRSGDHSSRQLSSLTEASSNPSELQTAAMLHFRLSEYQFTRKLSRKYSDDSSTFASLPSKRIAYLTSNGRQRSSGLSSLPQSQVAGESAITTKQDNPTGERYSPPVLLDSSAILNSPTGFAEQLVLLKPSGTDIVLGSEIWKWDGSVTPINEATPAPPGPSISMALPDTSLVRNLGKSNDGLSSGEDNVTSRAERLETPGPTSNAAKLESGKKDSEVMGLWEALASVDPTASDDSGLAEAYNDEGRRLSASEENRRVSYLMLLYPLAYGIILAVSIARLAVTLVTRASPSPWLQILNRVCVLGTGVVDACIYTIIEWRFRAYSRNAARSRSVTKDTRTR